MAEVTRNVFVRVVTWDPASERRVPLEGVSVRCMHARPFWDATLSQNDVDTDVDGIAELVLEFDDEDENDLNPYFQITIPEARRALALPGGWSGDQLTLPDEWETEHDEERRLTRLTSDHLARADALDVLVGLETRVWMSSCDAHPDAKGNWLAIPAQALRVFLDDADTWIAGADDILGGWVARSRTREMVEVGEHPHFPYEDRWPVQPYVWDDQSGIGRACIDPPGMPIARLGGGSYRAAGILCCDCTGAVWLNDNQVPTRFYPDGTLAERLDATAPIAVAGLCCDSHRHLYVSDRTGAGGRVLAYCPCAHDDQSGYYADADHVGGFSDPAGVAVIEHPAVDGLDVLAVADPGNHRVCLFWLRRYRTGGGFLKVRDASMVSADNSFNRTDGLDFPEWLAVGSRVWIGGFSNAGGNNAYYDITARAAGKLTLGGGAVSDEHDLEVLFLIGSGDDDTSADIQMDAGGVLRRNAGNFPDTLAVESWVALEGFASWRNNGVFRVSARTPNTLTLAGGSTEVAAAGPAITVRTVRPESDSAVSEPTVSMSSWRDVGAGCAPLIAETTLSVAAGDQSINDSANGFFTAGFAIGQFVRTSGFAEGANNGDFRVTSVTAGKIVLDGGGLVDEAAGATATVSQDPFQQPAGVAADRERRFYVADTARNRVSRFVLDDEEDGWVLDHFWGLADGSAGANALEFNAPSQLALDTTGNYLYVVDDGNNRVQRIDLSGNDHLDWAVQPSGIAVDPRGLVYLAEAAPSVRRYTCYDNAGARLAAAQVPQADGDAWTTADHTERMSGPQYTSFDAAGRLWVSDSGNHRVQTFERATQQDPFAQVVTLPALAGGNAPVPVGIDFDQEDHVYVVDEANHRVMHFDAAFAAQADIGTGQGSGDTELDAPTGIAVKHGADPWIYVADTANDRINIFRRSDGGSEARITAGSANLSGPRDVAIDAQGLVYVADTGNSQIAVFDDAHAHQRDIAMPVVPNAPAPGSAEPVGVAIDAEGRLLVSDRARHVVVLLDAGTGDLIAYWNLSDVLPYDLPPTAGDPIKRYRPELVQQVALRAPYRACVGPDRSLMAVADHGHDQVRLIRISNELSGTFTDLGRGLFNELPDIVFHAQPRAEWSELNFTVQMVDDYIRDSGEFSDPHQYAAAELEDYSDDHVHSEQVFTHATLELAESTNVIKVAREVHRWLTHVTQEDSAAERWDADPRALHVDITAQTGSFHPMGLDFLSLAELTSAGALTTRGRGANGWDDYVIAHEMGHWIFDQSTNPYPAFTYKAGAHTIGDFANESLGLLEGYAEYTGMHWQAHDGQIDRHRGYPMSGGNDLTYCRDRDNDKSFHYLHGGRMDPNLPSFDAPGRGLLVEGYIGNAWFQLHHLITNPGCAFADAPDFWHFFNEHLDADSAGRFARILRAALRDFPVAPSAWDLDHPCSLYWRYVLARAEAEGTTWRDMVQAVLELNNQLMPRIVITVGGSDAGPGADDADQTIQISEGDAQALTIQVLDVADRPLEGYLLRCTLPRQGDYTLPAAPGPNALHGRRTGEAGVWEYATNANGIVHIVFTAPAGSNGSDERIDISYQPDFDTDQTFAPPQRTDDLHTVVRKCFLHALRGAVKLWPGHGQNLGACINASFLLEVRP